MNILEGIESRGAILHSSSGKNVLKSHCLVSTGLLHGLTLPFNLTFCQLSNVFFLHIEDSFKTGTLTLGTIRSREGVVRRLIFVVRGPYRGEVTFGPVQQVPEFLAVELGEKKETETSVTMPVTIRIPPGSPAGNYLGGEQGELGEVMIETDHPQVPRVRIRVRFALEGSL